MLPFILGSQIQDSLCFPSLKMQPGGDAYLQPLCQVLDLWENSHPLGALLQHRDQFIVQPLNQVDYLPQAGHVGAEHIGGILEWFEDTHDLGVGQSVIGADALSCNALFCSTKCAIMA